MSHLSWNDPILQGAARALFVQAYASKQEDNASRGKRARLAMGGQDWMDVAPKTHRNAVVAAAMLLARLECANKASTYELLYRAARADGRVDPATDAMWSWAPKYLADFGHYIAMQAVGHGVSWFNDHARFELVVPHTEFNL